MDNKVFLQGDFADKHSQNSDSTLFAPDPALPPGEPAIEAVETLILPVAERSVTPLPASPALFALPRQRGPRRRRAFFIALPIVLLLLLGSGGYVLARPNLPASSATLRITPISQQFSKSYAVNATPGSTDATLNPIGTRRVSYTTPAQSATVQATGTSHSPATYATGTFTMFVFSGSVPAGGYKLTSRSGMVVAFYLSAPPAFRTDTVVSAQATTAGPAGNIPANDLNGAYQTTPGIDFSITQSSAFTGGSNGGNVVVVSQTDIESASSQVTNQLQNGLADDRTQLKRTLLAGEQLLGGDETIACQPSLQANHQANDQAGNVTVTGTMTCNALAYNSDRLQSYATDHLTADATAQLGSGYALSSPAQAQASGQIDQGQSVSFVLEVSGRFFYRLSPNVQAHLLNLIVGKTQDDAQKLLMQQPGIASVSLTVSGGLGTAMPGDAQAIQVKIAG